ncbi:MAG: TorF family putative porin [Bdellovibrionota bacterium]
MKLLLRQKKFCLLILFLAISNMSKAQTPGTTDAKNSMNSPSYKLEGNAQLTSNFVSRGLTQTNKDPGLQSAFWFNFGPQFRLGIWGSNVHYEGIDSHIWVRLNGDIKIDFSANANLVVKYSNNNYFPSNSRNGNTLGLHLDIYNVKVLYEMESNWEGTSTSSTHFAFQKTFDVFGSWKWDNQLGYSMLKVDTSQNYFDLRSFIGSSNGAFEYKAGATWTSSPSQFNGRGDLFAIFTIGVNF